VVHRLRRAARKGDRVDAEGYRFEVVDADKMRLNQLLVTKIPPVKPAGPGKPAASSETKL
jgi:CBS domain containing-hemolysin-like protein